MGPAKPKEWVSSVPKSIRAKARPKETGSANPKEVGLGGPQRQLGRGSTQEEMGPATPKKWVLSGPQKHSGWGSTQGERGPVSPKKLVLAGPNGNSGFFWLNLNHRQLEGEGPSHDPWVNGSRPTLKLNGSWLTP